MPSRLAVLVVADLVDYTRLMAEDEELAIGAIRELKETLLEPKMTAKGGEILKRMGDGWIIAFSSVTAALQSAMAVQGDLAAHPVIKLRMGAHMGEIIEDDTDFYGAGVNLAQRLETEAPPGGIMISQDLHRQLTGELAKSFKDAGNFKLKNIALPVSGYQWRPQTGSAVNTGEVPTICVEPFAYAPATGETEAAAGDLHEQLVLRLSRRTGIRVRDEAVGNAGDSVYLLRGRLRISGNRGRMNLSLVLRESGDTIWTQSYEGDTSDIFAFCDELIEKSVADLRIQINAFDAERIAHLPDDQLSVSELRSRAAANFYKCTVESWDHARRLLERALRLNSSDAAALAMHVHAIVMLAAARYRTIDGDTAVQLSEVINRAVELAPRGDFIFTARAYFRAMVAGDASGAMKDAERALSVNPSYHVAYDALGLARLMSGDFEGSIQDLEKSLWLSESDPLLPFRLFVLAIACHIAEHHDRALDMIERAIQLRPNERSYYLTREMICRAAGDAQSADEAAASASRLPAKASILAPRIPLPEAHAAMMDLFAPD